MNCKVKGRSDIYHNYFCHRMQMRDLSMVSEGHTASIIRMFRDERICKFWVLLILEFCCLCVTWRGIKASDANCHELRALQ